VRVVPASSWAAGGMGRDRSGWSSTGHIGTDRTEERPLSNGIGPISTEIVSKEAQLSDVYATLNAGWVSWGHIDTMMSQFTA